MVRNSVIILTALFVLIFFNLPQTPPEPVAAHAPQQQQPGACDDVRYLMANEQVPIPGVLVSGGGMIGNNDPQTGTITARDIGDYFLLPLSRQTDDRNRARTANVQVQFSNISSGLDLKFQLFQGMEPVTDNSGVTGYQAVEGNASFNYALNADGYYTLVIQRQRIADESNTGSYTVTVTGNFDTRYSPNEIEDVSITGTRFTPRPDAETGLIELSGRFQGPDSFWMHAGSPIAIASRQGQQSQVRFGNGSFTINNWAEQVSFTGGNLAVTGTLPENNTKRIFYLENYGYRVTPENINLEVLVDSLNNTLQTDWDNITGIWMMTDCIGIKFMDGRTFVSPVSGTRSLITGTLAPTRLGCDLFAIHLDSLDSSGTPAGHKLCFSLEGIENNSEILWENSMLSMDLPGERNLKLLSTDLRLERIPDSELNSITDETRLDATLNDRVATVTLDWVNMATFELTADEIRMTFLDAPRSQNPAPTVRSAVELDRFEALDDIIRIIYKNQGEQRLLLPASDSYLEIITPPGEPVFNPDALPEEIGYSPRGLNNTGGECNTFTLVPEGTCPPNGHPNPANGNLWISITDHIARGGEIDLTLTRSYNSRMAGVDGPFGNGWTSAYLLDYDIAFDTIQNARPIPAALNSPLPDAEPVASPYRVGLDLTWAPRGIVRATLPDGSRHIFTQQSGSYESGVLEALTMPGWTLRREDIRAERWILETNVGLVYEYDRAGRIIQFGYPAMNRLITIDYPRTTLNGPGELADTPIIITDAPGIRQLELYFDENHHIVSSILRDLDRSSTGDDCQEADNCYETGYIYDGDNNLVEVIYPNNKLGVYEYDDSGRLIYHDDPRAPIQTTMGYTYHENGGLAEAFILPEGTAPGSSGEIWISLSPGQADASSRSIDITDFHGNTTTQTYSFRNGDVRQVGETFTLASRTSLLAPAGNENRPEVFTWQDGYLTRINQQLSGSNEGRIPIDFIYNSDQRLTRVKSNDLEMRISYDETIGRIASITHQDGSTEAFTYDPNTGRLATYTDRNGAVYSYVWDANTGWLSERTVADAPLTDNPNNPQAETTIYGGYTFYGLPTLIQRRAPGEVEVEPFVTRLTYDNLGRLVAIGDPGDNDPADVDYSISYNQVECLLGTEICSEMVVIDPTGSQAITRFDGRNRIVEEMLLPPGMVSGPPNAPEAPPASYLRRTTWEYNDPLGRLTARTRWLRIDDTTQTPLTTTYTYTPTPALFPLPDTTDPVEYIGGYTVTVQDDYGRNTVYIYDALDRVRQIEDPTGKIRRFDYTFTGSDRNQGYRIVQRDQVIGDIIRTLTYRFRADWLLREINDQDVTGNEEVWELGYNGTTSTLNFLSSNSRTNIGDITTSLPGGPNSFVNGRPTVISMTQLGEENLQTTSELVDPSLNAEFDFMGRPVRIVDHEGIVTPVAYCPLPRGMRREVRGQASTDRNATVTCVSDIFARAITYDAFERPVRIDDSTGTRIYTYRAISGGHEVEVGAFPPGLFDPQESPDESLASSNPEYAWLLRYDSAGDLIYWQDEAGFEHYYEYDTLGRLTRYAIASNEDISSAPAEVEDSEEDSGDAPQEDVTASSPEATFTFTYNALDQLTGIENGLGEGSRYSYNNIGQLASRQDISTADSTVYIYDPNNRLINIITPAGNTITYLYEDAAEPTRLTGVIDATGSLHTFDWDNRLNKMTYTDPRGAQTVYRFDSLGGLWQITDADELPRTHELRYDGTGLLTAWLETRTANSGEKAINWQRTDADPNNYRLTIDGLNNRAWQYNISPDGMPQQITPPGNAPLLFNYDSFGRLQNISAGDNLWQVQYLNGSPVIEYIDPYTSETLRFDSSYRLREQVSEDDSLVFNYTTPDDEYTALLIEEPYSERRYEYRAGSEFEPPSIILVAPGHRITYLYNADGLLTEVISETCMDNDLIQSGNLEDCPPQPVRVGDRSSINVADQAGTVRVRTASIVYDASGRPIRIVDEEQNIEVFSYDDYGNLSTYQNSGGKSFTYEYDSLNRLIELTGPAGLRLLMDYDHLDRLLGICRTTSEAVTTYTACLDADNSSLLESYTYDAAGRLLTQSYPNQTDLNAANLTALTYGYNGLLTSWGITPQASVTYTYTGDGLSLLDNIAISSTDQYFLSYENLNRIAGVTGSSNLSYTVSEGRVSGIEVDGLSMRVTYDPDNGGYLLTSETGAVLQYRLDARGYLVGIGYNNNGTPDADNISLGYSLLQDTRLMNAFIQTLDSDRTYDMIFNRKDELTYLQLLLEPELTQNLTTRPPGNVTRQNLSGEREFFVQETRSYIVVTGYDNADRPLTLRITSQSDGELLYALAFTYNANGQRRVETRQYADGVQVRIEYHYDEATGQQLVERIIDIIYPPESATTDSPEPVSSTAPFLFLMALLLGFLKDRRRTLALLLIVALVLGLGLAILPGSEPSSAQTPGSNRITLTYTYSYDAAGNLSTINEVTDGNNAICASFRYDNAGRLVGADLAPGGVSESHTYTYDAYNRVTNMSGTNLLYPGENQPPIMQTSGTTPTFYAEVLHGNMTLFSGQGTEVQQYVGDGYGSTLTALEATSTDVQNTLWLFDPIGRYVELAAPGRDLLMGTTPCTDYLNAPDPTMIDLLPPQSVKEGMLWHGDAGLYFADGRAYLPEIGRFLQRDPLGPDALGTVYDYPARQYAPPIRENVPAYMNGLYILREAARNSEAAQTLNAAVIQQQYAPSPYGLHQDPFVQGLLSGQQRVRERMTTLFNLAEWLDKSYNLPGPYIDPQTRELRMVDDTAPTQTPAGYPARQLSFDTPLWNPVFNIIPDIASPIEYTHQIAARGHVITDPIVRYAPYAWLPDRGSSLVTLQTQRQTLPLPAFDRTPEGVIERLPTTLSRVEYMADDLDFIQAMQTLHTQRGADIVEAYLMETLPTRPDFPPQNTADWLQQWFSPDTFGNQSLLEQRFAVPPPTPLPDYGIGDNPDWIYPLHGR